MSSEDDIIEEVTVDNLGTYNDEGRHRETPWDRAVRLMHSGDNDENLESIERLPISVDPTVKGNLPSTGLDPPTFGSPLPGTAAHTQSPNFPVKTSMEHGSFLGFGEPPAKKFTFGETSSKPAKGYTFGKTPAKPDSSPYLGKPPTTPGQGEQKNASTSLPKKFDFKNDYCENVDDEVALKMQGRKYEHVQCESTKKYTHEASETDKKLKHEACESAWKRQHEGKMMEDKHFHEQLMAVVDKSEDVQKAVVSTVLQRLKFQQQPQQPFASFHAPEEVRHSSPKRKDSPKAARGSSAEGKKTAPMMTSMDRCEERWDSFGHGVELSNAFNKTQRGRGLWKTEGAALLDEVPDGSILQGLLAEDTPQIVVNQSAKDSEEMTYWYFGWKTSGRKKTYIKVVLPKKKMTEDMYNAQPSVDGKLLYLFQTRRENDPSTPITFRAEYKVV